MNARVPAALAGERVDRVVSMLTGLTRTEASALVDAGAVRVGGRQVSSRSRKLAENELLEIDVPEREEREGPQPDPDIPVEVVHADDDVIVVDKAPGLVVHPGAGTAAGTLVNALLARFPDIASVGAPDRPGIVHRLDKGTSGLLVVARSQAAYESLVEQLSGREVERRYLALVWGHLGSDAGLVDAPIGRSEGDKTRMAVSNRGREARTRYTVLSRFDQPAPTSLLECRLETGRTHQIRVHLAAIGHPVVGDDRYGGAKPVLGLSRPFLHAARLAFDAPATGRRCSFESPLPPDLQRVLDELA